VPRTSRRAEKARTHQRILAQASRAFREHGVSGVSIPALMNSIGLTHAAFYAHFGSNEALVAETYAKRIDDFIDGLLTSADDAAPRNEGRVPAAV
jgi:TetR/AcrR family transcriptional regulator, transcriptional repressor for nem operon